MSIYNTDNGNFLRYPCRSMAWLPLKVLEGALIIWSVLIYANADVIIGPNTKEKLA